MTEIISLLENLGIATLMIMAVAAVYILITLIKYPDNVD